VLRDRRTLGGSAFQPLDNVFWLILALLSSKIRKNGWTSSVSQSLLCKCDAVPLQSKRKLRLLSRAKIFYNAVPDLSVF
jgi:hypothetical protein